MKVSKTMLPKHQINYNHTIHYLHIIQYILCMCVCVLMCVLMNGLCLGMDEGVQWFSQVCRQPMLWSDFEHAVQHARQH